MECFFIYPESGSFPEFFGSIQVLCALEAPLVKMQEKDALGLGGKTRKERERNILYMLEKTWTFIEKIP